MFDSDRYRKNKKSPQKRFLVVIGILFFLLYFVLGIIVIFWKEFPLALSSTQRTLFGIVLIVYSFLRFIRLFQDRNN